MTESSKRTLYLPDDLWDRVKRAAAQAGARQGATVSISEWARDAMERKLGDDEPTTDKE